MSDCLSMVGVWKSYQAGVRGCSAIVSVLRDVHFELRAGEMACIAAAPAAGKTTLLMCAAGLLRPDRGAIAWFGGAARREIASRPEGIAYAGDRPFPYGFLSAREALEYAAIVRDLPLRDSATRVAAAIGRTGLGALSDRRVDSLDGNALARLAVAGTLLAEPRLILIDDIGPGCDAATGCEMLSVLRHVAREGAGVVVAGRLATWLAATESVHPVASRVFVLEAGSLAPTSERPAVAARRVAAALPRARVAEMSREIEQDDARDFARDGLRNASRWSAPENEAR
jgi:ABC-type multidrug transport system ATPase subunit